MKRRTFWMLLALLLALVPALAEGGLTGALETAAGSTPELTPAATPEPTPVPTPEAVVFEADGLRMTLPAGFEPLGADALEGFEAALRADYPGAAEALLAAMDAQRGAAILIAAVDADMDCVDAARDAADALLGDPDAATEDSFGENRSGGFACTIGEQLYRLHYFSDGARLIVVAASGLEAAEERQMLESLRLGPDAEPSASASVEASATPVATMEVVPEETLPPETALPEED